MQIKLKNQRENGKFTEVRFVGYPDGKDHFAYKEDIAPQIEFLKRSGIIGDQIKIILENNCHKYLNETQHKDAEIYTAIKQTNSSNKFFKGRYDRDRKVRF
jgi:hypothetical protein